MCGLCVRMHLATYLCTVYAHKLVVGPADESSHYKIMDENHPGKISPFMDAVPVMCYNIML